MHEYSLVRAMVDRVTREARARSATAVKRLTVRIGALSGVEPELFATAFTHVREGLLAEAELYLQRSETAWECPRCESPIPSGGALVCPTCQEPARLSSGDEILLEHVEMEVP